MELKEVLFVLKGHCKKIVLGGLVVAAFAYLASLLYPVKYRSEISVYVQKKPETSQRGDYTFDGYYALKAAEEYTDTVVGLLQSADVVERALQVANLPASAVQVDYFAKKIKVAKSAPTVIDLSLTLGGRELSATLITAIVQAAKERTRILNQEGTAGLTMDLINNTPLLLEVKPKKELNAVVGFLAGSFLAGAGVLLGNYLKETAHYGS